MMLQFRKWLFCLLFTFIILSPFSAIGQMKLTVEGLIEGAQAFDELLPKTDPGILPLNFYVRDSVSFKADHNPRQVRMQNWDINTQFISKDSLARPRKNGSYIVIFDNESRIINSIDSLSKESVLIEYSKGNQISMAIKINRHGHPDTLMYTYDNAGRVSGICHFFRWYDRSEFPDRDTAICTRFSYDIQGRLTEAENIKFEYVWGKFTYTYNSNGRIETRKFIESKTQTTLFSDSLSYEFADELKQKLHVKHVAKFESASSWILIDDAIIDVSTGLILKYSSNTGEHGGNDHDTQKGWSTLYSYDNSGRKLSEIKTDSSGRSERNVSYVWGKGNSPDSVINLHYQIKDGVKTCNVKTIRVTTYDAQGRVAEMKSLYYSLAADVNKKDLFLKRTLEKKFEWKTL